MTDREALYILRHPLGHWLSEQEEAGETIYKLIVDKEETRRILREMRREAKHKAEIGVEAEYNRALWRACGEIFSRIFEENT